MTYIYTELSTNEVAHQLTQDEYANWTYTEAQALAEYLEQLAEDQGEPIQLDICAIRCEFVAFDNIEDYNAQYETEYESRDDVEQLACHAGADGFICYEH